MTPRISVLVPAHDDGPFLEQNLASLAAQTCGDFEVLVADDASCDETPEIAAAWARRDPRFRLSRLAANVGMNRNWNRALAEARGELVIKLDADDAMAARTLELLVAEFDRTPDLLFAACRTLDCDADLAVLGPFRGDLAFRLHGLDPERPHLRFGLDWLVLCFDDVQLWTSDALLFRSDGLAGLGGWDERVGSSDTDLILRALALDRLVAHVPEPGILYRRRPGSSSHREHASGTARLEHDMIALRCLAQHGRRLRPLARPLRQNWWRLWRRLREDSGNERLWSSLTAERRASLRALEAETFRCKPPLGIRVEGGIRFRLWQVRERLRRSRFAASGEGRRGE